MMQEVLWKQLREFRVDSGDGELTFIRRLARENGWTEAFAERAFEEYRRFIFLAATQKESMTPSVAVDQVWHLHLCYTRSYWETLCAGILGKKIHHGPTRGGAKEDERYELNYERTKQAYRDQFEEEPDEEIWPSAAKRFSKATMPFYVTSESHWVIKKRPLKQVLWGAGGVGLAGCLAGAAVHPSEANLILFVIVGMAIAIGLIVYILRNRNGSQERKDASDGSGCGASSGCSTPDSDSKGHSGSGCGSHSSDDSSGCSSSGCSSSGCSSGCGSSD